MGAPVKPETAAALKLLEDGEAKSAAEAARRVGNVDKSTVAYAWKRKHGDKPYPYTQRTIEPAAEDPAKPRKPGPKNPELPDDDSTPQERELARKLVESKRAREAQAAELREARVEVRERDARIDELETVAAVLDAVESVPSPEWLGLPPDPDKHVGTIVSAFSDFHVGEVVEPAEMNGYNAYSPEIAKQRIRRWAEKTVMLSRAYLQGVEYDGIVVPSLGDTISGNIHEELNETNGLSNSEAVPFVVPLVEEAIGIFADEFGRVHVPCVPGNHPRDFKKPRYKGRSAHNADTMISKLVAARFANDDRVTFDIPAAFSADFSIYDTRFRIEHGDEAKGGTGIQGALAPLALRAHRVGKQAQAEGVPFDVLMVGHWHQLMWFKNLFVNGAGKGYDEYARGKAFQPEPPQQGLMVVTPEHGVSVQMPIFVGDREAEGW